MAARKIIKEAVHFATEATRMVRLLLRKLMENFLGWCGHSASGFGHGEILYKVKRELAKPVG